MIILIICLHYLARKIKTENLTKMANNNRAVEMLSSCDDETVVSITAEKKEETQNNVDPWPLLQKVLQIHWRKK